MRAIVVGAGLAGLSAATALEAGGAQVEILEARDRVGGRVWSRQLENGAVIEMGAEFVLPGNTAVRELATELGLGLWDKGVRYGRREPRGGTPFGEVELARALDTIETELAGDVQRASVPAAEFLADLRIDAGAREYILARAEISAANSATLVPAGDLLGVAHVDDLPAPSVAGGNQRLASGLAELLREGLSLQAPARRVVWSADGVRVQSDDSDARCRPRRDRCPGSRHERDRVRPAAARAARRCPARGPLRPGGKALRAARRPGRAARGDVGPRALLELDGNRRRGSSAAGGQRLRRLARGAGAARGRRGAGAVARFAAGVAARARAAESGAILSTWADDEWVRAAYSVSPGPEATAAMTAPCGPLAFAGEHTAGEYSGLMEGALRSGRRAAADLLGGDGVGWRGARRP